MAKRILIVGQHFWPESFRINDIVEYLLEEGYQIDVLCGRPNYPSGKLAEGYSLFNKRKENFKGATVYRTFEVPRGNNSNARIFINYVSFPFASIFHVPKLLTKKYDKILIYQLSPVMMSVAGLIIGKLRKTETTMYVLDLWPENLYSVMNIQSRLMRRIALNVSDLHYKSADKLVVLSETMKNKLLERTRKSITSISVIPQAAEKLYENHIYDEDLNIRFKDTFNVVFTGNISPAQSFPTMIEAARILKNDGLSNIRWIIVGDGMSRNEVESQVKSLDLDDTFIFEGHKPIHDIPKYTHIADVLVGCLVKSELLEATIPAKVMSYIASGKPLALSMDGEVSDLINNHIKCGFVTETEDASKLAASIKQIYSLSKKDRSAMGSRAQDYHFKYFERNLVLKKLETFIFTPSSKV